jgi:hypothetical protein
VLVYDATDGDLLHALKGHKVCHRHYYEDMPMEAQHYVKGGGMGHLAHTQSNADRMRSTAWLMPTMGSALPRGVLTTR